LVVAGMLVLAASPLSAQARRMSCKDGSTPKGGHFSCWGHGGMVTGVAKSATKTDTKAAAKVVKKDKAPESSVKKATAEKATAKKATAKKATAKRATAKKAKSPEARGHKQKTHEQKAQKKKKAHTKNAVDKAHAKKAPKNDKK
jgi:hypothetical protein